MLDVLVEHNLVLQSQLVLLSLFFYTLTKEQKRYYQNNSIFFVVGINGTSKRNAKNKNGK